MAEIRGYARMVCRATATALPGAEECVHPHTAATDARDGQERRDPGATRPTRHPAALDRQTPPHPARPGVPCRPPAPPTQADAAAAAPDRLPRHRPTLATATCYDGTMPRHPPEQGRPTAYRSQHQGSYPAPGPTKPALELQTRPRRTGHPWHHGGPVHDLRNPQGERDQARTPA
jgi:hypothetical protein